ncbi:hypothetical protein C0992_011136, partial [Termitomyces sp. T32_za158]
MGTEVLLQRLEATGQPVSLTALFLQDNLAVMVMEGLLDQIELMRRQRVSVLEQIDCAAKRKLSSPEGVSGETKRAQPQPAWLVEPVRLLGAVASQSMPAMAPGPLSLPARPTAASTGQLAVVATIAHEPKALEVPVEEMSLDQRDEEMGGVPLTREDRKFMDHFESMASSAGQKVGPASRGLAGSSHALNVLGPSKNHRGCKPPILIDNLELVDFPADIPTWAEPAQLLFLKEVIFPALPSQLAVVKLTTDPCTPAQYDGLTATAAAGKGKQQAVPTIKDDSDYGQLQSEEEEEAEEGESAAQRFQH